MSVNSKFLLVNHRLEKNLHENALAPTLITYTEQVVTLWDGIESFIVYYWHLLQRYTRIIWAFICFLLSVLLYLFLWLLVEIENFHFAYFYTSPHLLGIIKFLKVKKKEI